MYSIVRSAFLNQQVKLLEIEAPRVARKAKAGQFIILRIDEQGERIPLTIADFDPVGGTVTIIFQIVGKTTMQLSELNAGDSLLDFVGPLGTPSHLEGYQKVAVIGGGLGTAIAYPQAKALFSTGTDVDVIVGFRNDDLVILEEELKQVSNRLFIATDDGSYGEKGFVSDVLQRLIDEGNRYDAIVVIGPLMMMKVVCEVTRPHKIPTIVSMNPIMIDGTGMCGGCRLTVGGETKFACVDGPDFDGHLVDFDEAIKRSRFFREEETRSREEHCRLMRKGEADAE